MEFSQKFRPAKMAKSLELASFQAFFKCPKVEVLPLYPQRSYLHFLGCQRSRCLFMSLYLSKISANFQKSCQLILTWTFVSNWTKPRHWKTPTKQAFRRSISLAASDLWDVGKKRPSKRRFRMASICCHFSLRPKHIYVWVTQNQMYTHI